MVIYETLAKLAKTQPVAHELYRDVLANDGYSIAIAELIERISDGEALSREHPIAQELYQGVVMDDAYSVAIVDLIELISANSVDIAE